MYTTYHILLLSSYYVLDHHGRVEQSIKNDEAGFKDTQYAYGSAAGSKFYFIIYSVNLVLYEEVK